MGGLARDITAQREANERQTLLLRELNHRVKNTLALILSMARQTGLRVADVADFMNTFEGRVEALAAAHGLLTESGWRSTPLPTLIEAALAAHDERRIRVSVEELPSPPAAAQDLVLILHELATNAAKHGALSVPGGTVLVHGSRSGGGLLLCWHEAGGPPVGPPIEPGFGTTLLEQVVAHRHEGSVDLDWRPDGLVCTIRLPLGAQADRSGG